MTEQEWLNNNDLSLAIYNKKYRDKDEKSRYKISIIYTFTNLTNVIVDDYYINVYQIQLKIHFQQFHLNLYQVYLH